MTVSNKTVACSCEEECVCAATARANSGNAAVELKDFKQRDDVFETLLPPPPEESSFPTAPISETVCQPSGRKILILVACFLFFFSANTAVQTATTISKFKVHSFFTDVVREN